MTFIQALEKLLERKREADCTENTLRTYRGNIRRLAACARSERIDRLTADEINAYVRDEGVKQVTQNKRYRTVRAFLNFCMSEKLLANNPLESVEPVRAPNTLPKPLPRGAVDEICDAVRAHHEREKARGNVEPGEVLWTIPLIRWAAVTGMRLGECARMRWKHVDERQGIVRIPRTKSRREQTIPLHDKARAVLRSVRGEGGGYVFKSPQGESRKPRSFTTNISSRIKKFFRAAGYPEHSFHSLRHTFCTRCVESGLDPTAKELARHKSLSTTMQYVRLCKRHLHEKADEVDF